MIKGVAAAVLAGAALVACGSSDGEGSASGHAAEVTASAADGAGTPNVPKARPVPDAWLGRWTGPEGLFVDIRPGDAAGEYALLLKADLDSEGDEIGARRDGEVLRFRRNGEDQTLRRATGDETGLKWLAGKTDCLMIREGEGFCRP